MWSTLARLALFGQEEQLLPGLADPQKRLVRRLHLPLKTAQLQSLDPRSRCELLPRQMAERPAEPALFADLRSELPAWKVMQLLLSPLT